MDQATQDISALEQELTELRRRRAYTMRGVVIAEDLLRQADEHDKRVEARLVEVNGLLIGSYNADAREKCPMPVLDTEPPAATALLTLE